MFELNGKYNSCKIFTDNVDNETISQLMNLLNQEFVSDSQIRIMPDTHAGAGCVIGTTMTIKDKVVPNLVGVDIGCGMLAVKLEEKDIDLTRLDECIHQNIPSGFDIHDTAIASSNVDKVLAPVDVDKALRSLGTLGGGNHFIEVDNDKDGNLWLVIHTGSRHLGLEVCSFYQNLAYEKLQNKASGGSLSEKTKELIAEYKAAGRHNEIEAAVKRLAKEYQHSSVSIPKELAYVEGDDLAHYINDMKYTQEHARINRETIANVILSYMGFHEVERFDTIHNYIDIENMILRKGSISALDGEKVIIPMNMRDGSLICVGKGNQDWNCSAPHGAGRIMSRGKAKESISLDDFRASMDGIFTTCVNTSTIDESPMVYKPMDEIITNVKDTVDIIDIIKPIYNFKAN